MNKEAVAKYALKSFFGNQQKSSNSRLEQEQLELQQQQVKKKWWSKSQAPDSILSLEERQILKRVKGRAHFLDRGLSCCCFQIGFDGIVGMLYCLLIVLSINTLFRFHSGYWGFHWLNACSAIDTYCHGGSITSRINIQNDV